MKEITPTSKITLKDFFKITDGLPIIIQDSYGKELYADDDLHNYPDVEDIVQSYGDWIVYSLDIDEDRKFIDEFSLLVVMIWNP